jgi:hypothetical protein
VTVAAGGIRSEQEIMRSAGISDNTGGITSVSPIVYVAVAKHPPLVPLASVTVTVYVPAIKPERSCADEPLLQLYV